MHRLGSDYKDLIDIIFNTRPRNNRGQFEELDFNDALRQLINVKRRHKDRDSSKGKAILTENFKKRKINQRLNINTGTIPKYKHCGYRHDSINYWFKSPDKVSKDWRIRNKGRIKELRRKNNSPTIKPIKRLYMA